MPTILSNSGTAADEWEEKYSEKHKRKFWKNIKTGAVEWKEPVKPTIAAVDVASGGGGKTSESSVAEENKGTAPDEWEEKYSEKHKRKFWKNIKTGAVEWKEPVKPTIAAVDVASGGGGKTSESSVAEENKGTAPDEWEEKYSEKHKRKFWKNIKTGAVEWKEPVKPTIAAVDAASGGGGKTSESSVAEESKGRKKEVDEFADDDDDEGAEDGEDDDEEEEEEEEEEEVDPMELMEMLVKVSAGCLMTKKRGKAGAEPAKDSLPMFSSQKRWIFLDWSGEKDSWGIYYHADNKRMQGQGVMEGKCILLNTITDVFLEPPPSSSFRLYDGNKGVVRLTPIPTSTVVAKTWFDAVYSSMQLQNLSNEDLQKYREEILGKQKEDENENMEGNEKGGDAIEQGAEKEEDEDDEFADDDDDDDEDIEAKQAAKVGSEVAENAALAEGDGEGVEGIEGAHRDDNKKSPQGGLQDGADTADMADSAAGNTAALDSTCSPTAATSHRSVGGGTFRLLRSILSLSPSRREKPPPTPTAEDRPAGSETANDENNEEKAKVDGDDDDNEDEDEDDSEEDNNEEDDVRVERTGARRSADKRAAMPRQSLLPFRSVLDIIAALPAQPPTHQHLDPSLGFGRRAGPGNGSGASGRPRSQQDQQQVNALLQQHLEQQRLQNLRQHYQKTQLRSKVAQQQQQQQQEQLLQRPHQTIMAGQAPQRDYIIPSHLPGIRLHRAHRANSSPATFVGQKLSRSPIGSLRNPYRVAEPAADENAGDDDDDDDSVNDDHADDVTQPSSVLVGNDGTSTGRTTGDNSAALGALLGDEGDLEEFLEVEDEDNTAAAAAAAGEYGHQIWGPDASTNSSPPPPPPTLTSLLSESSSSETKTLTDSGGVKKAAPSPMHANKKSLRSPPALLETGTSAAAAAPAKTLKGRSQAPSKPTFIPSGSANTGFNPKNSNSKNKKSEYSKGKVSRSSALTVAPAPAAAPRDTIQRVYATPLNSIPATLVSIDQQQHQHQLALTADARQLQPPPPSQPPRRRRSLSAPITPLIGASPATATDKATGIGTGTGTGTGTATTEAMQSTVDDVLLARSAAQDAGMVILALTSRRGHDQLYLTTTATGETLCVDIEDCLAAEVHHSQKSSFRLLVRSKESAVTPTQPHSAESDDGSLSIGKDAAQHILIHSSTNPATGKTGRTTLSQNIKDATAAAAAAVGGGAATTAEVSGQGQQVYSFEGWLEFTAVRPSNPKFWLQSLRLRRGVYSASSLAPTSAK